MAELSALDLDCLEYQTGFLSGLVLASWGEPEKMNLYASRLASVMASLGRQREHDYYATVARTSAASIGLAAQKAWDRQPLRSRMTAKPADRLRFLRDHTAGILSAAEVRLEKLDDDVAKYRVSVKRHFTNAGDRR
jgi:hypothetical protein